MAKNIQIFCSGGKIWHLFFGNGTKVKIASEIKLSLTYTVMVGMLISYENRADSIFAALLIALFPIRDCSEASIDIDAKLQNPVLFKIMGQNCL